MQSGVDDLLYQHRVSTDGCLLGTIYLGKLVQGQAIGPMRSASLLTGLGGIPQSHRVDSHAMLQQQTCTGGIFSPHLPHPTECKMRRHTPQSQGGHTVTQWHVLLRSCLRAYGPYAEVGVTHVNPANQLRMRHPGKTLGDHSNKPWLS